MRLASVGACLCAGLLLAGCGVGGTRTTTVTVTRTLTSPAAGPKSATYFGIPVSITKLDAKRYALTIKPELFLTGVTANVLFAANLHNACAPLRCPGADDDRVVIPAGSRNLLFILPATTKGTVLDPNFKNVTVTAPQLLHIFAANHGRALESGLWVTVDTDTVTSFAQQFQP